MDPYLQLSLALADAAAKPEKDRPAAERKVNVQTIQQIAEDAALWLHQDEPLPAKHRDVLVRILAKVANCPAKKLAPVLGINPAGCGTASGAEVRRAQLLNQSGVTKQRLPDHLPLEESTAWRRRDEGIATEAERMRRYMKRGGE